MIQIFLCLYFYTTEIYVYIAITQNVLLSFCKSFKFILVHISNKTLSLLPFAKLAVLVATTIISAIISFFIVFYYFLMVLSY